MLLLSLQDFSYNDWSQYCLAHLFTYYEFPNSTLGFAYVASKSTGNEGGICSSRKCVCVWHGYKLTTISFQADDKYPLQVPVPVMLDCLHLLICLENNCYNLRLSTYSLMVSIKYRCNDKL